MTVRVKITGMSKTHKYLAGKAVQTKILSSVGLKNAALHLQNEVKQSIAGHRPEPTSVDTGRFLASVDTTIKKDFAIIFSNIPYSKHLEFGTSRIRPRRHFNNSKDREKQKITQIINKAVRKI